MANNKMMRAKEAADFLGIGISTLWRWAKEGRLPKGISLSARCTVWRREDLEKFVSGMEGESRAEGAA